MTETATPHHVSEKDGTWDLVRGFRFISVVALINQKRVDAKNREHAEDYAKYDRILDALTEAAEVQAEVFKQARKGRYFQITPKKGTP